MTSQKETLYLFYKNFKLIFSSPQGSKKLLSYYFFLFFLFPKKIKPNSLFNLSDFLAFNKILKQSFSFDFQFFKRLLEPQTLGLRLWEYSVLLKNISPSGKKILDIGTGTSLFPFFLAKKKAKLTCLDLKKPLETPCYQKYKTNPKFITGSVLKLPFKDSSFDLVTAISTLEHLDADYQTDSPVSCKQFLTRTKKALKEMVRVCKSGGLVYITTDFYLPSQKTDLWPTHIPYKKIGGAYKSTDLKLFLNAFKSLNLKPASAPDFDFKKLSKSTLYNNYRGRYFTTINFLYQKS